MVLLEQFESRPLSDFHPELRFEFPALPSQLFDYYLLRTAIRMAREGNLIRRRAVVHLQPCVTRYVLEAPDGFRICAITGVHRVLLCGPCGNAVNVPRSITKSDEAVWYDEIEHVLHADGMGDGKLEFLVCVEPERDACELPVEFYDKYLPTLIMGTRASIFMLSGRPWTNMRVGAAAEAEFRNMLVRDSVESKTHLQRGALKMNFGRAM